MASWRGRNADNRIHGTLAKGIPDVATRFLAFLQNLDADLRKALQERFRVLWTHHSTAIEGNTLTLGETAFVLGEGLTVAGKPLKDHQEVVGHARAIDLLDDWLTNGKLLTESELFQLHQAVQTSVVMDIYQPVGAWKVEPNGAQVVVSGELVFNDTYAYPEDVPALMVDWLQVLAKYRSSEFTPEQALVAYVDLHAGFVRIHPFADGNGRLARLLANIPLLEAGFPPLVISRQCRQEYLRALAEWQLAVGRIQTNHPLLPERDRLQPFVDLCRDAWRESLALVDEYHRKQTERTRLRKPRPEDPVP